MQIERIPYLAEDVEAEGVLVFDEAASKNTPLLLVAPNWMGVTDGAVEKARELAARGYVVFVFDVFGKGRGPAGTEEPLDFVTPYFNDPALVGARANAALEAMTRSAAVRGIGDARKRAAIGFCFGGSVVLELARSGADVAAVASMHGTLKTSRAAQAGAIKAQVIVIHGADDPISPRSDRDALEDEMRRAGAKWAMLSFGKVYHSFTDQDADHPPVAAFDAAATKHGFSLVHSLIADSFSHVS